MDNELMMLGLLQFLEEEKENIDPAEKELMESLAKLIIEGE